MVLPVLPLLHQNTNTMNDSGTYKFELPSDQQSEKKQDAIEAGDTVYHTSGKFLAVCVRVEGAYIYHRTMNGTEGNNYSHYYVKVESLIARAPEMDKRIKELEEMNSELIQFAKKVADWELPKTGLKWDDGAPMSYGAAYGSNGERDFFRNIAEQLLIKSQSL
jgi:hypothetical protein